MDPLSSYPRSESVRFHLIMIVCGYSIIVLLHRPSRQHRVDGHIYTSESKSRSAQHQEPTNSHQVTLLLSEQAIQRPKNTRTGGGAGMVVEVGVCADLHIFTHL